MAPLSRLLVLGGSNCQLHLIKTAAALGHRVLLADYLPHPPAAPLCAGHVRASTFDVDACTRAARDFGAQGVCTGGTDQPVYTAAAVANALGLPGLPLEIARAATDKRRMKVLLAAAGIATAPWRLLGPGQGEEALLGLRPPLVIKPVDSQGQRGVFKVQSAAEALERLGETLSFSRQPQALVEEFYPSRELTVSAWVRAGVPHLLTVSDREHLPGAVHIGVCAAHRFPTVHRGLAPQIEALTRRIAAAFSLVEGPLYIQLLLGEEGLRVNELALRTGGAFEDVVIRHLRGFDINRAVIALALGEDVSAPPASPPWAGAGEASVQLLFARPGRIARLTPIEELRAWPGVADCGYNFAVGECIPAAENATARLGHVVLCGAGADMGELVGGLFARLRVENERGESLLLPRAWRPAPKDNL